MDAKKNTDSPPTDENYKKSFMEKYGTALKHLIPIRCSQKRDKTTLPNNNVGFFSYVSANWMNKTMWNAARHELQPNEIKNISEPDSVNVNNERLLRLWNEELQRNGPDNASLHRTVWRFNRLRLIMAAITMTIVVIFAYIGPAWILEYILVFLTEPEKPLWHGVLLVIALSLSQLINRAAYSMQWVIGASAGVRIVGGLQVLIYDKVLRIKDGGEKLIAEVVNYSTSDIERIFLSMQYSAFAIGAPVMWILNLVYCYLLIGPWSLLGNLIILLSYPAMIFVGKMTSNYRIRAIGLSDKRISLMGQVLSSIKLIKMYAWENSFSKSIKDIRRDEEQILQSAGFLQSLSWTSSPVISIVAPMASIIGYVLCGGSITDSQAFTLMSVYSALLLPLNTLPIAVRSFSEGIISCGRIQKMLLAPDTYPPSSQSAANINNNNNNAVIMQNASVGWDDSIVEIPKPKKKHSPVTKKMSKPKNNAVYTSQTALYANGSTYSLDQNGSSADLNTTATMPSKEILSNVNLNVKKGQLIGICGNVGSGKSTLLAAISGNANVIKGRVEIQGKIAYVTQQAWIFQDTVMNNIIFGLPYIEQKYKMVVDACCLQTDFNLMTNGDQTEIGERGANLSGGQKQRISLARALYSDRDVYLLDDVLSAVDVKVSKRIFEKCIKIALRDKTVLLVSHAIHVLQHCDYILLLNNGEICERGTHNDLIAIEGEYAEMVLTDRSQRGENNDTEIARKKSLKIRADSVGDDAENDTFIKDEVDTSSTLTWRTFLYFCKMSGGYCAAFLVFLIIVVFNAAIMFNIIWLQLWLEAGSGIYNASSQLENVTDIIVSSFKDKGIALNPQLHMYVAVFGASALVIIFFGILKGYIIGKVMLKGSSALHHTMFWKVIRSPVSFFDRTPLGRIINRFSKDMDECDNYIPYSLEFVLQMIMLIIFQVILAGALYPWFFIGLAIIFVIFVAFDYFFNPGVRATKRLENLLRPPLLVHMSATVQGLPIIRCYEKQAMFSEKFRKIVDKHLSAYMLFQLSSKWLAFRFDIICWLAVTLIGFLIIISRNTMNASSAGLTMVQIFRICGSISVIMRWKSELTARLISIERIADYCKNLVEEAPAIIEDNRPPQEWPAKGVISFKDVQLRYRPELPLVLQELTIDLKGGEKVGIIGRTGAGKSSVIGCLLRLTEISGGSISIDGMDISKMGLKDLRSKIAVIPQEPVLFQGTIRWNLDPFQEFQDNEIWEALEKAHLKQKITKESQGLDTVLKAEGEIFSLGEKQLFCLSRAMLRKSRILLLDEATASIDVGTDQLIQKSIRTSFSDCTVIAIAHRLNTIADYDKIITMDAGKVVEFDSPAALMERDSVFRNMMQSMMESKYS